MTESLSFGRIAGIRVGAHWSVLGILLLIAVGLAAGRLPLAAPGMPVVAYSVAGLVSALVFLASLLAHEMSHALVARRNGVEVDRITLWLFGGVAALRGEPDSAGADLRIAGIGPLVSAVLGVAFLGASELTEAAGAAPLVTAALGWLGVINVVLAVFNLIPAAPLDGGRVLRAALWRWHGDRRRAALVAARAGRVFGFALIALGLAQVVLAQGFGGLWLALVGWFLVTAARAEEQFAEGQQALAGIRVADVMTPSPVTAAPELTVAEFLDRDLLRYRFSAFPLVSDEGRLTGLVTLNRIRGVHSADRATTRLRDIACAPAEVPTARLRDELAELLPRMFGCADGRAVVLDDDQRVVGIVSPSDIARSVQGPAYRPAASRS